MPPDAVILRNVERVGKPYLELPHTSLQELGYSIHKVKEWREREYAAGRQSALEDFYRAHELCFTCRATGVALKPVGFENEIPLFATCEVCHGTGRVKSP